MKIPATQNDPGVIEGDGVDGFFPQASSAVIVRPRGTRASGIFQNDGVRAPRAREFAFVPVLAKEGESVG